MYKPLPYPTPDVDPRLTNVVSQLKTLRRQIDDAEWNDKPVAKSKRDKLSTLKKLVNAGVLWEPKF
jgi:hypothetical protein